MGHICSNYYTYRLESNRRARNSWNYALIKRSFEILHPLSVGDVITNLTELPDGPYVVIRVGEDEKGRYARLKELPYIEYIIRHGEYRHISQVSLPFHDDIVQILYNEHRFFCHDFFKDLVFVTKKRYVFSYYDVMESEDVEDYRSPFKKYLDAIIRATEVYNTCSNIPRSIMFLSKLIIPSEIQIGKYSDRPSYFINLEPGSGYYWI